MAVDAAPKLSTDLCEIVHAASSKRPALMAPDEGRNGARRRCGYRTFADPAG
jgi:hypothetical protein